ncbi:hypothetical protein K3G63_22355 [Hymenobacter sp. HSC-4F20]|uniref:hypothetical protein n=1 Tax=Hymenobacter sp. HSC-4F20 TaxID=2864135 RepID=UPI001C732375|nr:hypothetical protein [Hymenobacter sp. HSC-4F20]MBX0293204.1 hypothetical protein [Hymenobacter sp. HSC-4F20]
MCTILPPGAAAPAARCSGAACPARNAGRCRRAACSGPAAAVPALPAAVAFPSVSGEAGAPARPVLTDASQRV